MSKQKSDDSAGAVRDKALRLLAVRGRSRDELAKRLRDEFGSEHVDDVLERLESCGLLNDPLFAEDRARALARSKGWGPHKIRADLRSRGIDAPTIERAVENAYEEEEPKELMRRLLTKRYGAEIFSTGIDEKTRAKAIRFLQGRGFDAGSVYSLWSRYD